MGLKIIAGRAKTGKSTLVYNEIKIEKEKNPENNYIIIVPELMTFQTEFDIIENFGECGIMNVEILSFKRLAHKVFDEVGGLKVQNINIFGKVMILKQLFEENINELKVFKKASKQEGFLKEFDELIQELKQNSVSFDSLDGAVKNIDNELLKRKLMDIELIYEKFVEKTQGKFFDEEDKMELFISLVGKSDYIKNSKFWIDGFESFNEQRYKLIKKLSDCSKGVTLTLNIDELSIKDLESSDDWEAFKTIYDTYESLKRHFGNDIVINHLNEIKVKSDEIKAIEKNLLSVNINEFKSKTDNIKIYSSMNPYTETEKIAAQIISLVRDYNYRWRDIRIAAANIDRYSINIKKVFTQYEIPFFLDVKRDIMDNPLTKYILSLLDMFIYNFKHDNVFEYLKTGLSPMERKYVNSLENYALKEGIEGSKWFKEFKQNDNYPEILENVRQEFAVDFDEKRKEFSNLNSSKEITYFILEFLVKHNIQNKINNTVAYFETNNKYEQSGEYAQVWNYIMDIFEQLILVGENTSISPKEYRKMLEAGFRQIKISIIPPTIDKIEIGDIDRIAVGRSKVLFIMGVNEGNIGLNNEKGLLLDGERETLLENNIKLMNSATYVSNKEKHLLYKLFTSPSDKLYLSYSLGTVTGETLQSSIYINIIKEIFSLIKEETDLSSVDELEFISNSNGTFGHVVSNIRDFTEGIELSDTWMDVFAWYDINDFEKSDVIKRAINYDTKVKPIDENILNILNEVPTTISVSKLENYAACPFKYFIDNILHPEPKIIQQIENYDLGNIYHLAIEEFTKEINNENIDDLTSGKVFNIAEKCINDVWDEYAEKTSALEANNRNKYMRNKVERVVKRVAYAIVRQLQKGKFRPKYSELQIGILEKGDSENNFHLEPIILKLDNGQYITLKGKIDRIDSFTQNGTTYVNVIDYKSSEYAKDISLPDAVEGLQIQLFVYLKALIENGGKLLGEDNKLEIGGAYYFHIDDPLVNGDKLTKDSSEDEVYSKLAMKGYILNDENVINNMDGNIDGTSEVIPVAINQDGTFSSKSCIMTKDEFEIVIKEIEKKSLKNTEKILGGNFDIRPYKKVGKNYIPCTYCDYKPICQFDTYTGNEFNKLYDKKDSEVLDLLKGKGGEKDGMDQGTEANN